MKKSETPDFEQLMEWLEGHLSAEESQVVAAQVAVDTAVQADVAWLRTFYQASQHLIMGEPSTAVTEPLEQRFAAYTKEHRPPSRWQSFVATLSFDSHAQLATGVRMAVAPEDQRQIIFTTYLATIVCTLQRRNQDRRFDLFGQFLPTQTEEIDLVRVQLIREKNEFDSTITDDLGEFALTALPAGFYDIIFRSDQFQITVSSLHLPI